MGPDNPIPMRVVLGWNALVFVGIWLVVKLACWALGFLGPRLDADYWALVTFCIIEVTFIQTGLVTTIARAEAKGSLSR